MTDVDPACSFCGAKPPGEFVRAGGRNFWVCSGCVARPVVEDIEEAQAYRERGLRTFDHQPSLAGELLELRPLRPDDWEALFAVACDPLIWEQHPDSDRYKEDVFRKFFAEALASGGALVAIDRATGQIVGSSRYHAFSPFDNLVEIGWTFLARRCWGGTYNGEMKRLMLEHAFQTVDRVLFVIGLGNRRSRRAVEKIGGVFLRLTRDANGQERVIYVLPKTAVARDASGD
jgi:RimJ/RimL family protein N-acetyltransferase